MVEGVPLWFVIVFVISLILYLLKSVFSGFWVMWRLSSDIMSVKFSEQPGSCLIVKSIDL